MPALLGYLAEVTSALPPNSAASKARSLLSRSWAVCRDRSVRLAPLDGRRLRNALKLARAFRQARHWSERSASNSPFPPLKAWPMSLSVEPTTACNLRCPECPSGLRSFTRPTGMLDPNRLAALLSGPEGLARDLVYLNLYFQGEPYLHQGMDNLVAIGKREGLYVSTSTNAHHITPERADRLSLIHI